MHIINLILGLLATAHLAHGNQKVLGQGAGLTLKIEPVNVSIRNRFANSTLFGVFNIGQVRDLLNGTSHRLLDIEETGSRNPFCAGTAKLGDDSSSTGFRATVADYTNGRTIHVSGDAFEPASYFTAAESNIQPHPSLDEIAEAAAIAGFSANAIAYATMPPIIETQLPNGTSHRVLNIIAREPHDDRFTPLHVNMFNRTATKAPVANQNTAPTCDAPNDAGAPVTPRGTPGTVRVTILAGATTLWTLEVVRPSVSSGSAGSGVELRYVYYKGKKVLHRAHVPILNVEYKEPAASCGPTYRDWQNDETAFTCAAPADVAGAPGFRVCSSPSRTIVDPPYQDGGNFNGVSFYVDAAAGGEVVIRSQLRAGWYRYTSEWRLAADGTMRPRFGFGGVLLQYNACVCVKHHHHAYWRLDFDIDTPTGNLVREYNNPPIFAGTNYHDKAFEIQRPRDATRKRHWEVSNIATGAGYALIPGASDGAADAYGVGDVWVLRYHPDELDDGVVPDTREHLEKYLTGEPLKGMDVVLWYAAHFLHDEAHAGNVAGGHVVGPDLKPFGSW
ncbi:copper amine oxidase [Podospora appendiculata]|uniref:Copper amine oxidase n=1 Tax=Podospora appendiculata TaxID=314037 RepID=A0AAE0X3S8_9PEZI|nr:copper amine oxidase [Podospora appendiculata]